LTFSLSQKSDCPGHANQHGRILHSTAPPSKQQCQTTIFYYKTKTPKKQVQNKKYPSLKILTLLKPLLKHSKKNERFKNGRKKYNKKK